ncbi:hypothetical protein AMTRI_Chr09g17890 [Amborella trichopoda]
MFCLAFLTFFHIPKCAPEDDIQEYNETFGHVSIFQKWYLKRYYFVARIPLTQLYLN